MACLSEVIFLKYQKLFCNISLHLSTNQKTKPQSL